MISGGQSLEQPPPAASRAVDALELSAVNTDNHVVDRRSAGVASRRVVELPVILDNQLAGVRYGNSNGGGTGGNLISPRSAD